MLLTYVASVEVKDQGTSVFISGRAPAMLLMEIAGAGEVNIKDESDSPSSLTPDVLGEWEGVL